MLLESGTRFGAAIHGFGTGDEVDFEAVAYASTDKPVYANGIVKIENSRGNTIASFDVGGTYASANFKPLNDGAGHLLVSYVSAPAIAAAVHLLSQLSGAETGGLADRHDGYAGGARDTWRVAVGWDCSIGHGPGSGG